MKISEIGAFYSKIFVYFSACLRLKKGRFSDIIITIYLGGRRYGVLPYEKAMILLLYSAAFFLIQGMSSRIMKQCVMYNSMELSAAAQDDEKVRIRNLC